GQQVLAVHPVPYDVLAGCGVRLGPLVLVVREAQVDAASVDVDVVAEVLQAHHRALDVPARKAIAPRAFPHHLAVGAGALPQGPVGVEPLRPAALGVDPMARPQVFEAVAADLPVPVDPARAEQHAAV